MKTYDPRFALFQVAPKALLWKDDKLLLLIHHKGTYDFPGGRMNVSEKDLTLTDILTREVREELGANIKFSIDNLAFITRRYGESNGYQHDILAPYFNVTLISGDITLSSEHTSFSWIDPKSILSKPENFMRVDEYEQYSKYFKDK
jgi:8-oxo-dGTP pyrophosphatase MutT (NUDIX family)